MKKIPSLFSRDPNNPRVLTTDYHALADWVVRGEGVATLKWDGTAVLVQDGKLFARYDAKRGKPLPPGFIAAQEPDPHTGHHPGWIPATRPEDRWIREAAECLDPRDIPGRGYGILQIEDGTYEACGPKIGGNPERLDRHVLLEHGAVILTDAPRDHAGLLAYFTEHDIEGVVWWRAADPNCDKIKITGAALGVKRPRGVGFR